MHLSLGLHTWIINVHLNVLLVNLYASHNLTRVNRYPSLNLTCVNHNASLNLTCENHYIRH